MWCYMDAGWGQCWLWGDLEEREGEDSREVSNTKAREWVTSLKLSSFPSTPHIPLQFLHLQGISLQTTLFSNATHLRTHQL